MISFLLCFLVGGSIILTALFLKRFGRYFGFEKCSACKSAITWDDKWGRWECQQCGWHE